MDLLQDLQGIVDTNKPDIIETVYYVFWDKGIGLEEFNELPIPYIIGILKCLEYKNKLEEKEMRKAKRKK